MELKKYICPNCKEEITSIKETRIALCQNCNEIIIVELTDEA